MKTPNTKCNKCNIEFYIKPFALTRGRGRYCSKKCQYIDKQNKSQKECPVCKKIFICKKSDDLRNRYLRCSKECSTIYKRSLMKIKIKKGKPFGERHWNWKGGITQEAYKIRSSKKYKDFRTSVFIRDNYTCQECKKHGGNLQVDHIKPFSIFPELIYDMDNCKTLCIPCHRKTDTFGYKLMHLIRKYGKEKIREFY